MEKRRGSLQVQEVKKVEEEIKATIEIEIKIELKCKSNKIL